MGNGKWYLETICGCYVCWQSKSIYVCILTYIHIPINLYLIIFILGWKWVHILTQPLIHYTTAWIILATLPCLLPLQWCQTWLSPFAIHLLNFQFLYIYIVSELLTYIPMGSNSQLEYSSSVQVLLLLQIILSSKVTWTGMFSFSLQWDLYICHTVRSFCHSLHSWPP